MQMKDSSELNIEQQQIRHAHKKYQNNNNKLSHQPPILNNPHHLPRHIQLHIRLPNLPAHLIQNDPLPIQLRVDQIGYVLGLL